MNDYLDASNGFLCLQHADSFRRLPIRDKLSGAEVARTEQHSFYQNYKQRKVKCVAVLPFIGLFIHSQGIGGVCIMSHSRRVILEMIFYRWSTNSVESLKAAGQTSR